LNVSRISKLFLLIAIILLISNTLAVSRDYQDSWILEGLEITFLLFVIAFAIGFFSETKKLRMVWLAVIGRAVFLLIPNLKYTWFQGTWIDEFVQYGLANYVYSAGHISTLYTWFFASYITTPSMHISFSAFSVVSNIPVVDAIKYLPVLWSLTYTFLTYIIVEKMEFTKGNALLRYALFFSSVPLSMDQYVVSGGLFGSVLASLILLTLVVVLQKKDKLLWVVFAIFVFVLATGHSVTSIILSVCLLLIVVIQRFSRLPPKLRLPASAAFLSASISALWLLHMANYTLQAIVNVFFVGVPTGTTPTSEYIASSFFEHLGANFLSAIKSVIVIYGADILFLILLLGGTLILLRTRKKLSSAISFILYFGCLLLLLLFIGYFLKVGAPRILLLIRLLYPVFAGLFVLQISARIRSRKVRMGVIAAIFLSIVLLSTIEFYGCQPLFSPANVLYKGLPADMPISYVNMVNSIYQRQVIGFAVNHINGTIAVQYTSAILIVGLAPINYSIEHMIWYYPIDRTQPKMSYDCFIIQLPGKSGAPPTVSPPLRTTEIISEYIRNSNVVYTNGESYILGQYLP
jgi:hypothetical protein